MITEEPTRDNTMEREFAADMLGGNYGDLIKFMEGLCDLTIPTKKK